MKNIIAALFMDEKRDLTVESEQGQGLSCPAGGRAGTREGGKKKTEIWRV
jgi:hypothetical protein